MRSILLAAMIATGPAAGAADTNTGADSAQAYHTWDIRSHRGAPTIWRDGQPITPMLFWGSYPMQYEVEGLSREGFELFTFFRSSQHYRHPYYRSDGSVALEYQEGQIRNLLSFNPDAYFLPRIFTTAPEWWVEANPGELCRYAGRDSAVSWERSVPPRESMASQKYLDEIGQACRKAIRLLLDSDCGKQLMGVHVAGGPWGEHFSWDAYYFATDEPAASDVSEAMRLALVDYLKNKYANDTTRLRKAWNDPELTFDGVRVPGIKERKVTTAGAWRDPASSRAVMDYFECHNEVVVRMIDHFCRIVKEESRGKLLTVVFYGYTQDENWPIENDHRAISKLLRLDSVDVLCAPHTYRRRRLGEDAGVRQYLGSAALHGKLFIDEGDDQTHLERRKQKPDHRAHARNLEESQTFLYREFGNMVTRGIGLWYMDLNDCFFHDDALIATLGRMKKWADASMKRPRGGNAQVALISAPESEFYLGYRRSPNNEISDALYQLQVAELYRTGAPFDWYLIDDLDAIKDRDYRVFIFMDCFYLTEQQRKTIASLRADQRTLIWFYAPGYASPENLSKDRMEELTGFHLQQNERGLLRGVTASGSAFGLETIQKTLFTVMPEEGVSSLATGVGELSGHTVLARKDHDHWTSVFSAVPGVRASLLREWFAEAGVHIYSDGEDILSANRSWLMIHTRSGGAKTISLPTRCRRVTEIVKEQVVAEDAASFTIELPPHATAIFLLE